MSFRGAFTALVTPFKNGAVDEEAYRALIEWQIEQGIDGVVPCGTTGEAATLSHAEQGQVIKICVDQVKGRVPVIAGAGSNNTREAIELSKFGEIIVDARGHTNVPGVFAAGDATPVPYKQIVIAAGDGAKAALSAFDHLIRH